MDMLTRLDVGFGDTDDLVVFAHCIAAFDGTRCDLMTRINGFDRGQVFFTDGGAAAQCVAGNHYVVFQAEPDGAGSGITHAISPYSVITTSLIDLRTGQGLGSRFQASIARRKRESSALSWAHQRRLGTQIVYSHPQQNLFRIHGA